MSDKEILNHFKLPGGLELAFNRSGDILSDISGDVGTIQVRFGHLKQIVAAASVARKLPNVKSPDAFVVGSNESEYDADDWKQLAKYAAAKSVVVKLPKYDHQAEGGFSVGVVVAGRKFDHDETGDNPEPEDMESETKPGDIYVGCKHIPYAVALKALQTATRIRARK